MYEDLIDSYLTPQTVEEKLPAWTTTQYRPSAPIESEIQEDQSLTWGDLGRSTMMGGAGVAEGLGFLAKKLGFEDSGQFVQDLGSRAVEYWAEGLSDHAKQELSKQFVETDENGDYRWGDASWDTVKLSMAQSALGTTAGIGIGGALAKGFQLVPKMNATVAGALGYGLGEGAIGAGQAGAGVEKEILSMSHEQLMEHPEYQAAFEQTGNEDQAKKWIADAASGEAAALAGLTTSVLSAPMGAVIGKFTAGLPLATSRARAIGTGALGEAGQEFAQSGAEQIAQNAAIQNYADQNRGLGEGALNSAVGGAAAGGILGGAFGTFGKVGPPEMPDPVQSPLEENLAEINGQVPPKTLNETLQDSNEALQNAFNQGAFGPDQLNQAIHVSNDALNNAGLLARQGLAQRKHIVEQGLTGELLPPMAQVGQDRPRLEGRIIEGRQGEAEIPQQYRLGNDKYIDDQGNIVDQIPQSAPKRNNELVSEFDRRRRLAAFEKEQKAIQLPQDEAYRDPIALAAEATSEGSTRIRDRRRYKEKEPEIIEGEFEEITGDEIGESVVKDRQVVRVPLNELSLSKDVPQFKSDANEKGIVDPIEGDYDELGMGPIQVWVRNDGSKEVISGRHRFQKARESGQKDIPAQYHYEKDGFDAKRAKALDAELNIKEGQGQVIDYVDIIRDTEITEEEAKRKGFFRGQDNIGKRAFNIANAGSDAVITSLRNRQISSQAAQQIALAAPKDEAYQSIGLKALQEGKSQAVAVNMIKAAQSLPDDPSMSQDGDLFGFDDSAMKQAEKMAKIASKKQREIKQRVTAVQGAAKNPKVAKEEGVNVNDPEALKTRIGELKAEAARYDDWHMHSDLLEEIRQEATPQVELNVDQEFSLETQTEESLAQQEADIEAKNQAEAEAKKQEEQRFDADANIDGFMLTGSDSQSDVAMAAGQTDIFLDTPKDTEVASKIKVTDKPSENKSQENEKEVERKAILKGEIPEGFQDKYKQWLKTLDQNDRNRLFGDGSKNTVRNQEFMTWSTAQNNQPKKTFIERNDELWKRIDDADKSLTTDELKSFVNEIIENEGSIKDELSKLTKKQLEKYYLGYPDSSMKKADLVERAYRDMGKSFEFATTTDQFISNASAEQSLKKLDSLLNEDFQKILKEKKAEKDKRFSEQKKKLEGIKNPKTLEDFRAAIRTGMDRKFTPEQWATYDRLHADERIEKQEQARTKTIESVDGEINYSTHEAKHTRKNIDLFIVSLDSRVDREKYNELNTKAKQLGGYYSSYNKQGAIPGFQFKSEEDRVNFLKVLEGDSVERTKQAKDKTDSLLEMAEKIEDKANEELSRDRMVNTAKRAREAGSAIESAQAELQRAGRLRAISQAIKEGKTKYLKKIAYGTDESTLGDLWDTLGYRVDKDQLDQFTEIDKDTGRRHWKKGVTPEQKVRFAEYPLTRMNAENVERIAKEMMNTKGFRQAGMKLRNDAQKADKDMYLGNHKHFAKFKEFIHSNQETQWGQDLAMDYVRLQRMGVETLPMLRAALLEYNEITSDANKIEGKSAVDEKLKYSEIKGQYKELGFFNSTQPVVSEVMTWADIQEGMTVLEPSAGVGHLADAAAEVVGKKNVTTNEFAYGLNEFLQEKGYQGTNEDFLKVEPEAKYDRVIMNPPFSKDQEITHIEHAYKFLKPGGRLVAVTSVMAGERQNKRNQAFKEWLNELSAEQHQLPEGVFKDAINPTNVNSKIIIIDKPSVNYSLSNNAKGISENAAKLATRNLTKETGVDIEVVETVEGLPKGLYSQVKKDGVESRVRGLYDSDSGKAYIVSSNLNSPKEAVEVFLHEVVGHKGLRATFGNKLNVALGQIYRSIPEDIRSELEAEYKGQLQDKSQIEQNRIIADEYVALLAQTDPKNSLLDKIISIVRNWLRKVAPNMKWTREDLVELLAQNKKALRNDKQVNETSKELAYSKGRGKENDQRRSSRNVRRRDEQGFSERYFRNLTGSPKSDWFLQTYVGNRSGPVKIFRGSRGGTRRENFLTSQMGKATNNPNATLGVWFSTDRKDARKYGSTVDEVYIDMRKPKVYKAEDIPDFDNQMQARAFTEKLQRQGFDGIIFDYREEQGPLHVIAFTPDQVIFEETEVEEIDYSNLPLYSLSSEALDKIFKKHSSSLIDKVVDAITNNKFYTAAKEGALSLLTLRQLSEVSSKYLPQMKDYVDIVHKMMTDRNVMAEKAADHVDEWQKWANKNKSEADNLANFMHDATLAGVDPSEEYVSLVDSINDRIRLLENKDKSRPGDGTSTWVKEINDLKKKKFQEPKRKKEWTRLRLQWSKLSPEAKDHFTQTRDAYRVRGQEFHDVLVERIERAAMDGRIKKELLAELRLEFESQKLELYFPLARFGNYFIDATDPHGERVYLMFETEREQKRTAKNMEKDGFTIDKQGRTLDKRFDQGASLSFVNELMDSLDGISMNDKKSGEIRDAIYQTYLQHMPDRSIRKQYIHRKGVAGFSQDAIRAFADRMMKSSYQLARLKHQDDLTMLMDDMEKSSQTGNEKGILYNEMSKRHEWVMNPKNSPISQHITAIGFTWMLGVSPAAAAVNLTQTPVVAGPVLGSRYGMAKAFKELVKTSRLFSVKSGSMMDKITNEKEREAFQKWADMGLLDATRAHDLAGLAEQGGYNYSSTYHKVMEKVAFLFHRAEQFNREVTALSAYRLAMRKHGIHEKAVKEAAELTWNAHFDYSNVNRARFMQGDFMKVAMQFKQYSQNITYFLLRNLQQSFKGASKEDRQIARRQLLGALTMTSVIGGINALPLGALYFIANAMLDDEDEPFDARTETHVYLAEALGKDIADWVIYGAGGAGVSSRVSLDDLWVRDPNRDLEGEDLWSFYAKQAVGPVLGGIAPSLFEGSRKIGQGEFQKGFENMVPKFVKDLSKAERYFEEGATTLKGDSLKEKEEFSSVDIFLQMMGIADSDVSKQYQENAAIKGYEQKILKRRQRLMTKFYLAWKDGDSEEKLAIRKEINEFNKLWPKIRISGKTLRRSIRTRERYRQRADHGVILNKNLARDLARVDWVE